MSHVTFPKPVRGSYLLERKTAQKQHKACSACKKTKPVSEFYVRRERQTLMAKCIECFQDVRKVAKTCLACGMAFRGKVSTRHCSMKCASVTVSARADQRRLIAASKWACGHCGKSGRIDIKTTQLRDRKFCSKRCEGLGRTRPRPLCRVCGIAVVATWSRTRTCGLKCAKAFRCSARKARVCRACRKSFHSPPSSVGRAFCSLACYRKTQAVRPMFVKASCEQCGATFQRSSAAVIRSKRVFCGKECARLGRLGSGTYNYRGGHDPNRGPGWQRLAEAIRVRDGHVCQRCNKTQVENKQRLSVDHIIPWREFTDKAAANDPTNLVSLCRRCHSIKTVVFERLWLKGDRIGMEQYKKAIQLPPLLAAVPDARTNKLLPRVVVSAVRGAA